MLFKVNTKLCLGSSGSIKGESSLVLIVIILSVQVIGCVGLSSVQISNLTMRKTVMLDGNISDQFLAEYTKDCSMPNLFIYGDTSHNNYNLTFKNVSVQEIIGLYSPISATKNYSLPLQCVYTINNNCEGDGKIQINLIRVKLQGFDKVIEYKVDCAPGLFYKPFEWGLFIVIIMSTATIFLSSLYSKAWSYGGLAITINIWIILTLNAVILIGIICAYFIPSLLSIWLKVVGSGVGTLGVMVCFSQTIYLLKWPILTKTLFWKIRVIEIPSFLAGLIITIIYWVTSCFWFINDIEAVCTIVAVIKIFKLRSLKLSVLLLMSVLLIEIVVGLIVHYFMGKSYNNVVINMFQSPIVVVFPSITPQLYRRCAWLPVTSAIMPGLVISYLRRFDLSRSTYVYILLGNISFFVGSFAWIFADMSTVHALPFAILSEPVMFIIVSLISWRRNQLKTLWNGLFYDVEVTDIGQSLLRETQIVDRMNSIEYQRMAQQVKAQNQQDIQSEEI